MRLCDIKTPEEMIDYLNDRKRFNSITYVSKYMKLRSAMRLFSDKKLMLSSPSDMNDMHEYKAFGNPKAWGRICYSCFSASAEESMAMWSMYAQPWHTGVKLKIPISSIFELISNTKTLTLAQTGKHKEVVARGKVEVKDAPVSLYRVAYANQYNLTVTNRNDRNFALKTPFQCPQLMGYVKDITWDYEKEIRLRVDLPENCAANAVYVDLPDEFLSKIEIITGPRFEGSVLTSLPKEYRSKVNTCVSLFANKLGWIPCDDCEYKKCVEKKGDAL